MARGSQKHVWCVTHERGPYQSYMQPSNADTRTPAYWAEAKTTLRENDPILGAIITRYEEPELASKRRLFETLAHSIVGQQISASAAQAVWKRFEDLVGTVTPKKVKEHTHDALRGVGLSRRKAEYILGLADNESYLRDTPWDDLTDDDVIKKLVHLRGVGPWTAQMVLIFYLLRPDVLPLGDIGLIRGVENLYADGQRLERHTVEQIADKWRPYRSVATWYIWRSVDEKPVEY